MNKNKYFSAEWQLLTCCTEELIYTEPTACIAVQIQHQTTSWQWSFYSTVLSFFASVVSFFSVIQTVATETPAETDRTMLSWS